MKIDHKFEKINFKIRNLLLKFNIISKKKLNKFVKIFTMKAVHHKKILNKLIILWPNLKNLSGGLNLSRGLNMIDST